MRVSTSINIYIFTFQCIARSELSDWKEYGNFYVYDSFFRILKRWIPPNGIASLNCDCLMWILVYRRRKLVPGFKFDFASLHQS